MSHSFQNARDLLVTSLFSQWRRVTLLVLLLLWGIGLQLLGPLLLRLFLDAVTSSRDQASLFAMAFLFLSAAFLQQIVMIAIPG
jgi:ATP-binding cassette, subfamily B, bacterial